MTQPSSIDGYNGWRGEIGARVGALEQQVLFLIQRLDRIAPEIASMREDVAVLRAHTADQSGDLKEISKIIEQERSRDLTDLQRTIEQSRESTRNLLFYLLAPLIVFVVGGLILFALTGNAHP